MKVAYPVIFTEVDTNILIDIPDLGILTEANEEGKEKGSMFDAIMMARDAIGTACIEREDDGEAYKEPSRISDINIENGAFANDGMGIVSLVDVDLSEYRKKTDTKTVRRNVALPSWLNYEAEHAGINVSRVLQEALMRVLNVERNI